MIHLVTGMQGSGKTLLLVKTALEKYRQGKKIYSNVALKGIPYKPIDYNDIVNYRYENAVVIIDEVHQLLPSRRSLSKVNVLICDGFLSMVRKKNLEIWGSTQYERKVDIRFREEADYKYLCEKWAYIKNKWIQVSESTDLNDKIPVRISVLCFQTFSEATAQTSFSGNEYYRFYDTSQIIEVKGIKC